PASPVAPGKEGNLLIMKQVAPRFPEAAIGWQGAGVDTSGLGSLQIRSTSPGGATHGLASNPMIWPEVKAVGWDWSADETRTVGTRRMPRAASPGDPAMLDQVFTSGQGWSGDLVAALPSTGTRTTSGRARPS